MKPLLADLSTMPNLCLSFEMKLVLMTFFCREQYGEYQHKAKQSGRHTVCFGNQMSTVTAKFVKIGIHHGTGELLSNEIVTKKQMTPVQERILELSDKLVKLREKEQYLKTRMTRQIEVAKSTSERGFYLSLLESLVIVGINLGQIYHLRKFFESKGYMLPTYTSVPSRETK